MGKKLLLSNSGVCWIDENCLCRIFEKNYGQSKFPLHERLNSIGRQFYNKTYRFHPTYLQLSLMIDSQRISMHPNSAGIAANQIQRFLTFFLAVNKGFFKLRKKKDVGRASKALQEPILRPPCLSATTGRLCPSLDCLIRPLMRADHFPRLSWMKILSSWMRSLSKRSK